MCLTLWFNAHLVITDFVGRISGLGEDLKKIISLAALESVCVCVCV